MCASILPARSLVLQMPERLFPAVSFACHCLIKELAQSHDHGLILGTSLRTLPSLHNAIASASASPSAPIRPGFSLINLASLMLASITSRSRGHRYMPEFRHRLVGVP